ncbi:50S ribosomal protein L11 methyltransferase [Streptomyces sp. NPDC055092]
MTPSTESEYAPKGLVTLPDVYKPQADTFLLARALKQERLRAGMNVLDVGTGNGILAICAASQGTHVTATDIAWRAVATTSSMPSAPGNMSPCDVGTRSLPYWASVSTW